MKCVHLIVSGSVQGVFFRANVKNKALELGLKGYAKNLENGDVEIAAQGSEEKIAEMIGFIKQGPGAAKITGLKIAGKKQENFKDFRILD